MSYDHTSQPSSSLGGSVFLLLLIMVGLTVAMLSTGMAGPSERHVKVVLPTVGSNLDQKK